MEFDTGAGRLSMYQSGAGQPILLIHSVNAAASAAEVRPLYERFATTHHSFALELPGFGFSERSNRPYTVRLMTDAIHAAVAHIQRICGAGPIDALSLSLSCEFLARAIAEQNLFRSVAFVSPTGLRRKLTNIPIDLSGERPEPWQHKLLTQPGWGGLLFRALTRPSMIRYFLRRTWGSSRIDEQLWRFALLTTQQPGAEHAPLYFLSGALFSDDAVNCYEQIDIPVWMCNGDRGDFGQYPYAGLLETRPNWRHSVFPTGALPYFEELGAFCSEYDCFLERARHCARRIQGSPTVDRSVV